MENLELYEKFRKVPQEAKKEISAGRLKGFTDINPMWRIKMLTETFGICGFGWYTKVIKQSIETGSDGQKSAFVDIELYIKMNNEWSMPIYGTGGSSFVANESKGAYTSDECFKMAYTDALSIACKSLGIGADVYFAKDRTKYDIQPNEDKKTLEQKSIEAMELDFSTVKSRQELKTIMLKWQSLKDNQKFKETVKQLDLKYPQQN